MFQYNFISKRDIKKYVIKSLKVIAIDKITVYTELPLPFTRRTVIEFCVFEKRSNTGP